MNIRDVTLNAYDFNLQKRDKVYEFIQQTVIGESYNLAKMKLGDLSWDVATKYFLDSLAYKDNMYYLFYQPELKRALIQAKDNNQVPDEVKEIFYNTIYPVRVSALTDMQKQAFEEKNKGAQ